MPPAGFPVLRTERLILRLARSPDAPELAKYYRENWDHLAWSSPILPPETRTEAYWRRRSRRSLLEFRKGESVRFILFDAADDATVVGLASLTGIRRGPHQSAQLGYGLARSREGRGLMTEALRAILAYARDDLKLHRIEAEHLPENARSARVLRRVGFQREGIAREYLKIGERWRDHVLNAWIAPAPRK